MRIGADTFAEFGSTPAPAGARFARTHDIDEQAALLTGWNQTYAQTSSGRFEGSILEVALDGVRLFAEETSNALYQTGALPNDLYAVGVPLRISGGATFCGTPTSGGALHVFSGDGGFEFLTPGGLVMAGIVVRREMLLNLLAVGDREKALEGLDRAHLRQASVGCAQGLGNIFCGVFELFRRSPDLRASAEATAALGRSLVSALTCALIDHDATSRSAIAPSRRWEIVRAARDLSVRDLERPVTIAEMCAELGVSRRTLQYCFQEVLGVGAAEFLRAVRLSGARRALKTAPSVTEAASLWGFLHFGRFAQDYRAMFGERPSETFRRYHPKVP